MRALEEWETGIVIVIWCRGGELLGRIGEMRHLRAMNGRLLMSLTELRKKKKGDNEKY